MIKLKIRIMPPILLIYFNGVKLYNFYHELDSRFIVVLDLRTNELSLSSY